ncbi:hypothetical protein SynM161_01816 [Synechococcus sp. M16.1]|nr:hypothetical protein SynM161_01816 [Synechococcus sp. M16.1]
MGQLENFYYLSRDAQNHLSAQENQKPAPLRKQQHRLLSASSVEYHH